MAPLHARPSSVAAADSAMPRLAPLAADRKLTCDRTPKAIGGARTYQLHRGHSPLIMSGPTHSATRTRSGRECERRRHEGQRDVDHEDQRDEPDPTQGGVECVHDAYRIPTGRETTRPRIACRQKYVPTKRRVSRILSRSPRNARRYQSLSTPGQATPTIIAGNVRTNTSSFE